MRSSASYGFAAPPILIVANRSQYDLGKATTSASICSTLPQRVQDDMVEAENEMKQKREAKDTRECCNKIYNDINIYAKAGKPQKVELTLPKFKVEMNEELTGLLQQMGLRRMFLEGMAQLGRIGVTEGPLCVSSVCHAVFVAVDEVGTEVRSRISRLWQPTAIQIVANRPFFFGLVEVLPDGSSVNTVFIGAVNKPQQSEPQREFCIAQQQKTSM